MKCVIFKCKLNQLKYKYMSCHDSEEYVYETS